MFLMFICTLNDKDNKMTQIQIRFFTGEIKILRSKVVIKMGTKQIDLKI